MGSTSIPLNGSPVRFGTDGWRGVLGVDITIERMMSVAAAASQELLLQAPANLRSRSVVIGFDHRFLSPELAEAISAAVRGCELEPLLATTALPTPACSWAVLKHSALGALVVTASHNPPEWLGLKIKGPFGCSVDSGFTDAVERRLAAGGLCIPIGGSVNRFDFRKDHLDCLRKKFDLSSIASRLKKIGMKILVDPMHGSASGCLFDLFSDFDPKLVTEIRSTRDPLFGGNPPEPLIPYVEQIIKEVKSSSDNLSVGLIFDGDGDRIAAVDEDGHFCSTQLLIPIFIDHLVRVRQLSGDVVKTVSGSDLIRFVAEDLGRNVLELPVGFKYIAAKMLSGEVLLGGEESGGVGFGIHLPERDALFAALLLLEAIAESASPLGKYLQSVHEKFQFKSFYDRIDLRLSSMKARERVENFLLENNSLPFIGLEIVDVVRADGVKFRFGPGYWLMFRFSGTEPLLRIYCEAPNSEKLSSTLKLAKEFIDLL